MQVCDVDLDAGRDVGGQALDVYFAQVDLENPALELDSDRLSRYDDRNADSCGYRHRQSHQIGVQQTPLNRIGLPILDDDVSWLAKPGNVQLENGIVARF